VLARVSLTRDGGERVRSGETSLSVAQAVEKLGALAEIGTDSVIAGMGNDTDPAAYELVADLVRQVADL
jgi:hypothetical protein